MANSSKVDHSQSIKKKVTPPKLALRYGIGPDKVLAWIRSGELRAINASTKPRGSPRYLIDERDIEDFEARRATSKPVKKQPIRHQAADVIEFF